MRFCHCIRAAPLEFCLYGYAAFVLVAYIGLLVAYSAVYSSGIPGIADFIGVFVGLFILLVMPLAFVGAVCAPLILLVRRIVWRKRAAFCIYEFVLHLLLSFALAASIVYIYYIIALVA